MAGGTSAQVEAMAQAARRVDNAGQDLAVVRGRIQQAVTATQGGYQSDAANLFRNVMAQWDGDFKAIIDGLEQIRVALVGTQRNYVATMEQERQSANTIATVLNGQGNI
jgi:WXG100 family type VII secretion target